MASLTIRQLDETTKARLRVRAARHRRSPAANLADAVHRRFRRFGGVELRLPARQPMREPPEPGE